LNTHTLRAGNAQDDRQNLADSQNPHRRKAAYALTLDGDSPLQYLPQTIDYWSNGAQRQTH
jgi:hypothetical protein